MNNQKCQEITIRGVDFAVSYGKVIARNDGRGMYTLDPRWHNFSRTTTKYRNRFIGADSESVNEMIKRGRIKFEDLN